MIEVRELTHDGLPLQEQGRRFYNRVGLSFEHPNVFGKLTGHENLRYHAGLYSVPTEDPRRLLEMVGLTDAAHRRASAYSKGMKQRLVFARSLVNRPSILFLDEPTSGLDPATAERVKEIIRAKRAEGCTIFLTTHNMQTADELCDVVAFLNDGRIVAMDAPRALKLQYGERSVAVEHRTNGSVVKDVLFPFLLISIAYGVVVVAAGFGFRVDWLSVLALVVWASLFMTIFGLGFAAWFRNLSHWFFPGLAVLVLNLLPFVSYIYPVWSPGWVTVVPSYALVYALREALFPTGDPQLIVRTLATGAVWLAAAVAFCAVSVRARLLKGA